MALHGNKQRAWSHTLSIQLPNQTQAQIKMMYSSDEMSMMYCQKDWLI